MANTILRRSPLGTSSTMQIRNLDDEFTIQLPLADPDDDFVFIYNPATEPLPFTIVQDSEDTELQIEAIEDIEIVPINELPLPAANHVRYVYHIR